MLMSSGRAGTVAFAPSDPARTTWQEPVELAELLGTSQPNVSHSNEVKIFNCRRLRDTSMHSWPTPGQRRGGNTTYRLIDDVDESVSAKP